jgi:hypothetical protein
MDLKIVAKEIREILDQRRKELGLTFIEEKHIYYMKDTKGEIRTDFPSVSKVLKKFYKEFPTEEAAYNKAGGDPQVQQQLIEEWAKAGEYSTNLGSRVHYMLEKQLVEDYGNYKEVRQPIFDCDLGQIMKGDSMISAGVKFLKLMKERNAVLLDTEMVLGDPELGYTGAPDKVWLVENKEKTGIGIIITDYKTNKPKNFEETRFTGKMYEPFQKVSDTALGHYFAQLPFYGKLLLKMLKGTKYENLKLLGCIVVLLKDNSEYVEYRVPKEVIDIILGMDVKKYLTKK